MKRKFHWITEKPTFSALQKAGSLGSNPTFAFAAIADAASVRSCRNYFAALKPMSLNPSFNQVFTGHHVRGAKGGFSIAGSTERRNPLRDHLFRCQILHSYIKGHAKQFKSFRRPTLKKLRPLAEGEGGR